MGRIWPFLAFFFTFILAFANLKSRATERKQACTLFYCLLGVMNDWKGFKIRVKIMAIKSAEINAALN